MPAEVTQEEFNRLCAEIDRADLLQEEKKYAVISFGYSDKYVLPHDSALVMMKAFEHAEILTRGDRSYDTPHYITAMTQKTSPTIQLMSETEYLNIKMSDLLGVTIKNEK